MKWWKAGLKNFLVSTCITRRIRRRAIRDYQMVSAKILPTNSTIAPTAQSKVFTSVNDYSWKCA
jgi:hypothetical protein